MPTIKAELRHWTRIRARCRAAFGYRSRLLWTLLYLDRRAASSGIWALDRQIWELLGEEKGFYVELGANNGYLQSNTLWLEIFFGWRGLLIEPVETSFLQCQKYRSGKRNRMVRAACVSDSYKASHVELSVSRKDKFSLLWASPMGVESSVSDPLAHGRAYEGGTDENFDIELAPARTLTSILDEVDAPSTIRFLSLDVEGGEMEVLKGLNFLRYSIEWILVETQNSTKIGNYLESRGYSFHSQLTPHDYLFHWGQ